MAFWKKFWKKKNKDKAGASEFEEMPLPSEESDQIEKAKRARRNNLSYSRSGRMKSKARERSQLSDDLFNTGAGGVFVRTSENGEAQEGGDLFVARAQGGGSNADDSYPAHQSSDSAVANGSFGKNSCREAQQQLMAQHQSIPAIH